MNETIGNIPPAALDLMHMKIYDRAEHIEDIFCLVTLVASGKIGTDATLWDSRNYYENLPTPQDCSTCPCCDRCMACIINE